jgi:hypothetical protein
MATQHSGVSGQSRDQLVDAISIRERPAEIEDRAIPGHWEGERLQEQSYRDLSGTSFAFYRARKGAQQRHGCCGRRAESTRSQTPRVTAALIDLGPGTGDGKTQDLHSGHECESLLLRSSESLAARHQRKYEPVITAILP